MELSIANLFQTKAFTSKPVPKEITWGEHTFTTYVRPLSYQTAIGDINSRNGMHDVLAGRIASSICDADGKAVFTPADVTGEAEPGVDADGNALPPRGALDPALTNALLAAIAQVQNLGKTPPSN